MAERLVDAEAVAQALGVSAATVKKMAKEGRIPVVLLSGRPWRFDLEEVIAALKRKSEGMAGEDTRRTGGAK